MREQLPRHLRPFDDPWGIVWRAHKMYKRADAGRTWRQQRARLVQLHQDAPIFVLGVPRSGTTAVYRLLASHPDLKSIGREGHDCWRAFHHPRRSDWSSDWVRAGDVRRRERSFVRRWWYARAGDGRFIDKTPCNAMRISYLLELFPDAHIVWAKRDPRSVLASLINGWEHDLGRFRTYYVPEGLSIAGYGSARQWCFGLPEGWRDLRTSTIPRIVTEQFRQYSQGPLEARSFVAPEQWHEVFFEDLLESPVETTRGLLSALHLAGSADLEERARALHIGPVNAMSDDGPSSWSDRADEVLALVDELRASIDESGYDVDGLLAGEEPAPRLPARTR